MFNKITGFLRGGPRSPEKENLPEQAARTAKKVTDSFDSKRVPDFLRDFAASSQSLIEQHQSIAVMVLPPPVYEKRKEPGHLPLDRGTGPFSPPRGGEAPPVAQVLDQFEKEIAKYSAISNKMDLEEQKEYLESGVAYLNKQQMSKKERKRFQQLVAKMDTAFAKKVVQEKKGSPTQAKRQFFQESGSLSLSKSEEQLGSSLSTPASTPEELVSALESAEPSLPPPRGGEAPPVAQVLDQFEHEIARYASIKSKISSEEQKRYLKSGVAYLNKQNMTKNERTRFHQLTAEMQALFAQKEKAFKTPPLTTSEREFFQDSDSLGLSRSEEQLASPQDIPKELLSETESEDLALSPDTPQDSWSSLEWGGSSSSGSVDSLFYDAASKAQEIYKRSI